MAEERDGGFDSRAVYINNTDYYTARTTLSPTLLAEFAKKMGIDPNRMFQRVYIAAAYTAQRHLFHSRFEGSEERFSKSHPRIRCAEENLSKSNDTCSNIKRTQLCLLETAQNSGW